MVVWPSFLRGFIAITVLFLWEYCHYLLYIFVVVIMNHNIDVGFIAIVIIFYRDFYESRYFLLGLLLLSFYLYVNVAIICFILLS